MKSDIATGQDVVASNVKLFIITCKLLVLVMSSQFFL